MKSLAYYGNISDRALELLRRKGLWLSNKGAILWSGRMQRPARFSRNLAKMLSQEKI